MNCTFRLQFGCTALGAMAWWRPTTPDAAETTEAMKLRRFSIDSDRLAAYRARADEARGASRLAQARVEEARRRVSEAQADLHRTERSRPGQPRGVIRIVDGQARGSFESQHASYVESARRRLEAAQDELRQLAAEQGAGAARREHDLALWAKVESYVKETGR